MYFLWTFGDMNFQDYFLSGTSNNNLAVIIQHPNRFNKMLNFASLLYEAF